MDGMGRDTSALRDELEAVETAWGRAVVANDADEWITDVFVRGADGWRCTHTHLTAARDAS